jgi:SSS family solute:Na+ symporter
MILDTAAGIRFGDVLTLLAYFSVTLGIGVWCALRLSTTEGYFVGNRSIPGWAIGVSMLGTAISSVTFLAYPGSAFSTNWSKLVPGLMIVFAVILAVYVFVPYFRRANLVSAYEYLEYRFDPWARVYGCVVWSLYQFYRMGLILYLLALPVRVMTGYDVYFIIVVLGILITIYTVMGGLEAVIWTDVMQTIVLLMGGVLCIWIVFAKVPESTGEMLAYAWNSKKFSLADPDPTHVYAYTFNFLYETIWVLMLYGLFQNLQEFASDQTRVQRYCAAKSDVQARNAVWLGGLGCIPVWAMFMFVGTSLWLFYQQFPRAAAGRHSQRCRFSSFHPNGITGRICRLCNCSGHGSSDVLHRFLHEWNRHRGDQRSLPPFLPENFQRSPLSECGTCSDFHRRCGSHFLCRSIRLDRGK